MAIKNAKRSSTFDLDQLSREFANASPQAIVQWVIGQAQQPVITTNFKPLSIALLHIVHEIAPTIPVIWVDTGFNTESTLAFIDQVMAKYSFNLHVYRPVNGVTYAFDATSLPAPDTAVHKAFTDNVKIEPFKRAMAHWQPDFWLTGIRADQTAYRRSLATFSPGPNATIRVAPLLRLSEIDVEGYIYDNELPDYDDYFDPTKGDAERECGLQMVS